jgi:hypothetical protein
MHEKEIEITINVIIEAYVNHPANDHDEAVTYVIDMLQRIADDWSAHSGGPKKESK